MAGIFQTPELAIGIAVGSAAGAAFEPKLEVPKQTAWAQSPNRLPDIGLIAELVAGGKVKLDDGHNMAKRLGFDTGPFNSLVWLAQNRLDFPLMLRLWRLFPNYASPSGKSIDDLLDETLAHANLDWDYHDLLTKTRYAERPGIGDIAYSVVRGYLPTDINLPVSPPSGSDYVPRFPQASIKAEHLAKEIGYDEDMLRLMVARSGLSMAPVMAANALFRTNAKQRIDALLPIDGHSESWLQNTVGQQDYELAISEGDLRTEWAHAVRETAREILTAGQYAELELRGYIGPNERRALTAQHGMRDADSDMLYNVQGRGLSLHSAFIADRRGGVFKGPTTDIPDWAMFQLQRGNLRPEVYNMAWAGRETLPSAFVVRSLLTDGAISESEGETLFLHMGWPTGLAKTVATHYSASGGSTGDKHVAKAQTQLWTTTHRAYLNSKATDAEATSALTAAGVASGSIPAVLQLWQEERTLDRKTLSPAQVKKAWVEQVVNPATNAAWTHDEALAYLIDLGMSATDAATFLEL